MESDASASKQHPTLTSTGWQITDTRDDVVNSLMHMLPNNIQITDTSLMHMLNLIPSPHKEDSMVLLLRGLYCAKEEWEADVVSEHFDRDDNAGVDNEGTMLDPEEIDKVKDEPVKLRMETEVVSMVTVPIQQSRFLCKSVQDLRLFDDSWILQFRTRANLSFSKHLVHHRKIRTMRSVVGSPSSYTIDQMNNLLYLTNNSEIQSPSHSSSDRASNNGVLIIAVQEPVLYEIHLVSIKQKASDYDILARCPRKNVVSLALQDRLSQKGKNVLQSFTVRILQSNHGRTSSVRQTEVWELDEKPFGNMIISLKWLCSGRGIDFENHLLSCSDSWIAVRILLPSQQTSLFIYSMDVENSISYWSTEGKRFTLISRKGSLITESSRKRLLLRKALYMD
ncbi:hypothetical protein Tco_0780738 [Tanacetum coccineum]